MIPLFIIIFFSHRFYRRMELLDGFCRVFGDVRRGREKTYAQLHAEGYVRRGLWRSFGKLGTVLRALPKRGHGLGRMVRMVGLRQGQPETPDAKVYSGTLSRTRSRIGFLFRDQQDRWANDYRNTNKTNTISGRNTGFGDNWRGELINGLTRNQ